MLGMRLQIVAFVGVGLRGVVGAIEQRLPEARYRLLFDCFEAAADLVVQPHRAVQFGGFGFAQRKVRPHAPRRPDLPDVTENEPGQRRPQREQDRVDESNRKLAAAFRHPHTRDSTERYATKADSRGRTRPYAENAKSVSCPNAGGRRAKCGRVVCKRTAPRRGADRRSAAGAAPTRSRWCPAGWRPFPWSCREPGPRHGASGGWNSATSPTGNAAGQS